MKIQNTFYQDLRKCARHGAQEVVGGKTELVEEAVDETVLRLFSQVPFPRNPYAWCKTVARNVACALWKKARVLQQEPEEAKFKEELYQRSSQKSKIPTPQQSIEIDEAKESLICLLSLIQKSITSAAPIDQKIYRLFSRDKKNLKEISEELELTHEAVRQRWSRFLRMTVNNIIKEIEEDSKLKIQFETFLKNRNEKVIIELVKYSFDSGRDELLHSIPGLFME